jgi:hypothetical protein
MRQPADDGRTMVSLPKPDSEVLRALSSYKNKWAAGHPEKLPLSLEQALRPAAHL